MSPQPILLGAALVLVAGVGQAQQSVHFTRESILEPAVVEDRVLVDSVRANVARVRVAEEAYYAANGTYASELADLTGVQLSEGVTVVIVMSDSKGWRAEATHPSLPGAEVVEVTRLAEGDTAPDDEPRRHGGRQGRGGRRAAGSSSPGRPDR
jgi:hypothetical protein